MTNKIQVIVAPYSLEAGEIGKPNGPEKIVSEHRSLKAAGRVLGSIISGKRRTASVPYAGFRGGVRIFARDLATGHEYARNACKEANPRPLVF